MKETIGNRVIQALFAVVLTPLVGLMAMPGRVFAGVKTIDAKTLSERADVGQNCSNTECMTPPRGNRA